jgi:hypothetical protein
MTINLSAIFGDEPTEVVAPIADDPAAGEPFSDVPDDPAEQLPRDFGAVSVTANCGAHNDPTGWTYAPDRYNRAGWRTASCKYCGRFIGYQPPQ